MDKDVKVSIVTPLFNREEFIKKAWNSIKSQTYQNWEWLVVDDHSSDKSFELIQEWARSDLRIKPIRRDRSPKGAPTCRNVGLALATGEYVIFFDSDDLLRPYCLQQRVELFSTRTELDFLVFGILIQEEGNQESWKLWNVDSNESDLDRFIRRDAMWQTMGPIYRKEFLEETDGFLEGLSFRQDYEFHMRLLVRGCSYAKFLDRPDCILLRHKRDSISQDLEKARRQLDVDASIYTNLMKSIRMFRPKAQSHLLTANMMIYMMALTYAKHRNLRFRKMLRIMLNEGIVSSSTIIGASSYVFLCFLLTLIPIPRLTTFVKVVLGKLLIAKELEYPSRTMGQINGTSFKNFSPNSQSYNEQS